MIAQNLQRVRTRIAQACVQAQRSADAVQLLAVSKTFGPEAVRAAYAGGQRDFGENYVQEALDKMQALRDLPLVWHCIGPLQSNKTRAVAEHFDWVHSIARLHIAERLSAQRPASMPALQVCIQLNVDGGANKSGVDASQALALAQTLGGLPRLQLRGLMCIPEPAPDFVAAREVFARAAGVFHAMQGVCAGLDTLSMGMSADLEAAVQGGSTLVRVGSAIFGTRAAQAGAP